MTKRLEQRYSINFFQKLGDSLVEIIQKIQMAFGDDARCIKQTKKWNNQFKDGRNIDGWRTSLQQADMTRSLHECYADAEPL